MDIKIITCNRANNFGARLQAYALWKHLSGCGHRVEVIDYCPPYLAFREKLLYNTGLSIKEWVKLVIRYAERRRNIDKYSRLERFSHAHTTVTERCYTSAEELRTNPPQADVYIAGSDQIWNTQFPNGRDPAFYLDFGGEEVRRISYAASFATPDIEACYKPTVEALLRGLDSVSVREESGRALAQSMGIEAEVVCDPAFLLTADEWSGISDNKGVGERYLLIYDFERSADVKKAALRIAAARGLKLYSVSSRKLGYEHRDYSHCDPATFISLVKNATCVVSNSLHGTIFSMIFERDFYLVNRLDGLNVRMNDLLNRYSLTHRIVTPETPEDTLTEVMEYTQVRKSLASDIEKSKRWLAVNLSNLQKKV